MAFDLLGTLKNIPWWGYAAGGGVALAGGYYIVKGRKSSSASTPASQVSSSPIPAGLNAADLAGLPMDYQDYDAEYAGDTAASATNDTTTTPPPSNPGVSVPGAAPFPEPGVAGSSLTSAISNPTPPPAAPFPRFPVSAPANPVPVPTNPTPPPASPFGQLHEHAVWDEWVTPSTTGGVV